MKSRQIVLDTETTGLKTEDGHRIIELGCIELINRRFTGNNLHFYFNPDRLVDPGAMAVHGITNEFLHDKPRFQEHITTIIDYLRGAELIIHNAPFDVGFLDSEFARSSSGGVSVSQIATVMDTLVLARQRHAGQKNTLDALCKRYHIDLSQRQLHGALLDAHLLAQVYLAMTGGQESLFAGLTQHVETSVSAEAFPVTYLTAPPATTIILADAGELDSHQLFLDECLVSASSYWEF